MRGPPRPCLIPPKKQPRCPHVLGPSIHTDLGGVFGLRTHCRPGFGGPVRRATTRRRGTTASSANPSDSRSQSGRRGSETSRIGRDCIRLCCALSTRRALGSAVPRRTTMLNASSSWWTRAVASLSAGTPLSERYLAEHRVTRAAGPALHIRRGRRRFSGRRCAGTGPAPRYRRARSALLWEQQLLATPVPD
jgi:hypothetical protein